MCKTNQTKRTLVKPFSPDLKDKTKKDQKIMQEQRKRVKT